jgi:hypothetical protein
MSDGRASAAMDRLPWLDDEPKGSNGMNRTGLRRWAPWLALTAVGVASSAYWLGRETGGQEIVDRPAVVADIGKAETTMSLPEATKAVEELAAAAPPQVEAETRKPSAPPVVRHGRVVIRKPVAPPREAVSDKPEYWPATASAGASGRMVRIGTFASRAAAKKGWRAVMGIYPGMKRIPTAVVAVPSARDGQTYYRLQMGTTSQAHSEVLCQRMRIIGQSCVVVGLDEAAQ